MTIMATALRVYTQKAHSMKVIKGDVNRLEDIVALFDKYRMFYGKGSEPQACSDFIKNNIEGDRSLIFLLLDEDDKAVAFSQLYPSFSSVAMQPIYYLYDLYVDEPARGKGYSKVLMTYIQDYFKAQGVQRLTLDTAVTNTIAQSLYESIGYQKDTEFIVYHYKF